MKIHLRETKKKPEEWVQSPHIYRALKEGTYAACRAGCCDTNRITDNPDDVTCKACLNIINTPNTKAEADSIALLAGEVVTWTHVSQRGQSIKMTTREGKVIGPSKWKTGYWLVLYRGKQTRVHRSHLRRAYERTTLTELVMGPDTANIKVQTQRHGGEKS